MTNAEQFKKASEKYPTGTKVGVLKKSVGSQTCIYFYMYKTKEVPYLYVVGYSIMNNTIVFVLNSDVCDKSGNFYLESDLFHIEKQKKDKKTKYLF